MAKTKTFSLYLAKSDIKQFEDVFTQKAKDNIKAGAAIFNSNGLGTEASVYVFKNNPRPPNWLSMLTDVFQGLPDIKNKTSCAVIVFSHLDRVWISPFAHGWQFIDDAKIEMDFGLKVAINSLDDDKIKRIDRNHLGEAMKGVSQSAFQRDLQAFGIDEALDLVRRISGRKEGGDFARSLSGATALKISREMELSELADVAEEAFNRYNSDDYKKTGFYIIDKVRPILDRVMLATLDDKVVEIIKNGGDNFELSMPGWSEDDVVYYGLYGPGLQKRFPDLLMSNYRDAVGDKLNELTVEKITSKHGVFAEFNNDAASKKKWSIKKSLIGSVVVGDGLYAISEGEWYRLDQLFKQSVDDSFDALFVEWDIQPLVIITTISEDRKKQWFETELEYNTRCATEYGQVLLDQKILTVPEIPFGKFEACDLLDIDNKRLIHVKKSSRQSSVLSHFFKQGSNSARILKTIPAARDVMIEKVRSLTDGATADKLKESFGVNLAGWTIEFHIVDAPRNDGKHKIPFFSRITLRDEALTLKAMEFKVALKFIST